uniref:Uncharacterized protein n=1 Tax=Strigamia maritima TaxID=126957 RepID=T1J5X8_STRMM
MATVVLTVIHQGNLNHVDHLGVDRMRAMTCRPNSKYKAKNKRNKYRTNFVIKEFCHSFDATMKGLISTSYVKFTTVFHDNNFLFLIQTLPLRMTAFFLLPTCQSMVVYMN